MRGFKLALALGAMLLSSACASIIDGTTQTVSFESNPPGAECALLREGITIGKVTTPGGLVVEKTKHNINVTCRKEGYQDSTAFMKSDIAGATFGNIVAGGFIGWAIDSASGADNKYPEVTTVTLIPVVSGSPIPAASGASSPDGTVVGSTKEQRLRDLDSLRSQNLITESEYKAKRQAIIDSL